MQKRRGRAVGLMSHSPDDDYDDDDTNNDGDDDDHYDGDSDITNAYLKFVIFFTPTHFEA